jgi:hypothetical protein
LQKKVDNDENVRMPGRPFYEETKDGAGFKEFLLQIVDRIGSADPRRRSEILGHSNTISDVHAECLKEGWKIRYFFPFSLVLKFILLRTRAHTTNAHSKRIRKCTGFLLNEHTMDMCTRVPFSFASMVVNFVDGVDVFDVY